MSVQYCFRSRRPSQRVRQRISGQALIITMAFCAILGAALLAIYNTIELSASKRDLVTAADATAYSGASIIAQGLNYTAYTNRAILANNALIGQMTAARSTLSMSQWYWKNTKTIMQMIAGLTRWIPYVGAVASSISNAAAKFADLWGSKAIYPIQVLTEVLQTSGTAAVGLTNQVIWLSQQVHMADSMIGFEPNMIAIAKDNAPDAQIDPVLHATAYGPLVTLGMFASQFKVKVRQSRRTIGTNAAKDDEYLNYVTEVNRHELSPDYLAGRNLLPNAVGLWIATGCGNPATSAASGAFADSAGLGSGVDTALRAVDTFASLLSVVVNPIMCMYDRHGGSELVQLEDGKMAWTSIDAMAFKLLDLRIPIAGGANMSFTEKGRSGQRYPDAVKEFERLVTSDRLFKSSNEYMGHLSPKANDCVEYLAPGSWSHYAVSTDTRISGTCAVLASGSADHLAKKGLWGSKLESTTRKIVRSKNWSAPSAANILATMATPFDAAANDLQAQLSGAAGSAPNLQPANGPSNSMPAGISGASNGPTTAMPDTAGLRAAGEAFTSSSWMTGSMRTSLTGMMQRLNPANFYVDPAGIITSAAAGGGPSAAGRDGGPGFWERLGLRIAFGAFIDVDALINLMRLQVSDGVERPRNTTINNAFNVFADGLPPYFWDVRIRNPNQSRGYGKDEDLVYTDGEPNDYHDRRYGLGPLVYAPLIKRNQNIETSAQLNIGGKMMGLPDYEDNRAGLRAIGKARVYYRQPGDQWLPRYKIITTANLILPYWQVRNESLSYVDKVGLLAIDGISNIANP